MRKFNRKSPLDFILPFLILLSVGVVGILGYQIWQNWDKSGKADAYFYVVEGKAKVLPFGKAEWENAYSGTKILLGDSLKTSALGKLAVVFFNGTVARLGNDTSATLNDLTKSFDSEKIVMNLNNGYLWMLGGKSSDVKVASYEVRTPHMRVKANGTVFEVEDADAEVVRVFEGDVSVDIILTSEGKERVAETVAVGVGQELVLDEATLKAFEENKSPSVLKAISDQFKMTDWYLYNMKEDKNPTNFAQAESGSQEAGGTEQAGVQTGTQQSGVATMQITAGTEQTLGSGTQAASTQAIGSDIVDTSGAADFGAPVIEKPLASDAVVSSGQKLTISGTVGKDTVKVQVEQMLDGTKDVYTLGKYVKGSTSWSYNVSEALGNLRPGENTYTFYAYDKDGNKSDPGTITITYDKAKVTITDTLEAPVVVSYNGGSSSTVAVDTVKVVGSVKGAEKVYVNDYALSKFVAGSGSWSYTAKVTLGNLNPGLNDYEVYAVAPDGTKSAVTKFTITYNKPEGTTSATTTTGTRTTGTGTTGTTPTQQATDAPVGF